MAPSSLLLSSATDSGNVFPCKTISDKGHLEAWIVRKSKMCLLTLFYAIHRICLSCQGIERFACKIDKIKFKTDFSIDFPNGYFILVYKSLSLSRFLG